MTDDADEVEENFQAIVTGTPTRWTQLLTGVITVEDLDDEELVRGQTRDRRGGFSGNQPKNVPRAMHKEIQRRLHTRGLGKMQESFFLAIETVTGLMVDPQVDPVVRFNSAKYIIERIAGKTPDKVEMSVEVKKYEQVLDEVIRLVPQEDGSYGANDGAAEA